MKEISEVNQLFSELAEIAQTKYRPFYAYSRARLRERARGLKTAISKDIKIYYSLKANPHPEIVKSLKSSGCRADVSSLGELRLALNAGYSPSEIEFTGPGKTDEEIETAVDLGVAILVIESIQELSKVDVLGQKANREIPIVVRISPTRKVNSSGRSVSGVSTQFGVSESEFTNFASELKTLKHIEFLGTHSHAQSQHLVVGDAIQNFKLALEASKKLADLVGQPLKFVNLGGGLGTPYTAGQESVSVDDFSKEANSFFKDSRRDHTFSETVFALEFGRFLVAEAGFFVTRVVATKNSEGRRYVIVDGGFTQAQIVCGIGQVIRKNFVMSTIPVKSRGASATQKERVTICGPSCYSSDVLAEGIELPRLDVGDLVVVHNLGAYGATFSPRDFLHQQRADEVFIGD